ncbi:hypothetical protein [Mycobacterium malmoense]|uniref:hypothetical protein n=1 Tax=Mycobacterium malmoense TaxID=1780 RepID=UPI0008F8F017|nr:hypothetical protein [Mycobacterium malmoense]OIN80856.1 hypothetical protein BMG05_11010 [Mycobacterium malmoense]
MSDPNVNASAESVADKLDGVIDGQPLPYDEVDMLAQAEKFSLSGTVPGVTPVAYPEGENKSSSFIDHVNTLTKEFARTYKDPADGKVYDPWDAIMDTHDIIEALAAQVSALTAQLAALQPKVS